MTLNPESLEQVREVVGEVQRLADAEVIRARASVIYYAEHLKPKSRVNSFDTGADLGQTGESNLAQACRRLDVANAQAAAVRYVWLHLVSKLGEWQ